MVVVVTGAAGFIGSRVASVLADDGWDVVPAGRPLHEIPSPAFAQIFDEHDVRLVIHSAGPASVQASVSDPRSDRAGSVDVTRELLALLEHFGEPPQLLVVSSAAVYGEPQTLPVSETAVPTPISPYGRHRLEVEQLALRSRVPTAIARVFSAYGQGLRRQVLWDIARKAIAGGPVELWGTGAESRDFVHVEDVGRALSVIARGSAFENDIYNVGSGEETTIAALAELLLAALRSGETAAFRGVEREGDPARWLADIHRLQALGWSPSVALPDGVARYAEWVQTLPA
jgi:UDP-glucose 4-epimerase